MEQGRAWRRLVSCLLLYSPLLAHSVLERMATACASVDRRDSFLQSLCSHRRLFSAQHINHISSLTLCPSFSTHLHSPDLDASLTQLALYESSY